MSPVDVALEVVSAVGVALAVMMAFVYWPNLPERIATHFGFSGKPDGWGPKSTFWIMPGAIVAMYAALTIVSRFPHAFNYLTPITQENAERQYRAAVSAMRWLKTELVCLLLYGQWAMIQTAIGQAQGMSVWFTPVLLIVVFGTTALLLIRSYNAR